MHENDKLACIVFACDALSSKSRMSDISTKDLCYAFISGPEITCTRTTNYRVLFSLNLAVSACCSHRPLMFREIVYQLMFN
jgi:hypothetical protein